ncbi:MAG TPA: transposase, partial [Candidatus Binataceae bacterium]|nr:transposase [Candidatus Binataceae bacterium]
MAGRKRASLPWARGPWSSTRRGSTIAAVTNKVGASASPAGSCRLTCGARPRSPRCCRFSIGARPNGEKELLAVEDGCRESAESWKALLRDLKRRGMTAPALAVGDGALGFWAAVREVWPETREQACWCHKLGNVLHKLPKRLQPRAKRALHEMMYAESRAECEAAKLRFEAEYQAKYPKAVESLTAHWERLVTFFDFPAEHWKHLRTTNVIESPFATVRLRERATRGAGSRTKGLLMAF